MLDGHKVGNAQLAMTEHNNNTPRFFYKPHKLILVLIILFSIFNCINLVYMVSDGVSIPKNARPEVRGAYEENKEMKTKQASTHWIEVFLQKDATKDSHGLHGSAPLQQLGTCKK